MCIKYYRILLLVFIGFNNLAGAMDNAPRVEVEPLSLSSHTQVPLEKQEFLVELGQNIVERIYNHEEDIDFLDEDYFNLLELNDFRAGIKYSRYARYAFVTNTLHRYYGSNDEDYHIKRTNHLTAIVGVVWYLTSLSKEQGEIFPRGSFTILDPGHALYNLLLSYVSLVNGCEAPSELPYAKTKGNYAYRRNPELGGSSHHKGRTPEGQFGIDIRFNNDETLMKLLPFSMAHILFGKILDGQEEELLFIKYEPVGLGSKGEACDHTFHFAKSGHVEGEARREREEDIPRQIHEKFSLILDPLKVKENTSIKTMYSYVAKLAEQLNNGDLFERCNEFLTELNNCYPDGFHHLRYGNEVMIDLSKL